MDMRSEFLEEMERTSKRVVDYIYKYGGSNAFRPIDIGEGVYHYTQLGGKRLRPVVLLACCGAVGGDPDKALPAAASVEMYHTWTLIHDDIIDRDTKRRHGDTVHSKWAKKATYEYGWKPELASHYGLTVAILVGDVQQGWSVASMLPRLYWDNKINAEVVLTLVEELDFNTLKLLVEGETLDVQYSTLPIDELDQSKILDMLQKKTGSLYRYCGMAGAMIGLDSADRCRAEVTALSEFTDKCGTAFQIQDDILGIVGEEDTLGKPVGSDIREGKRTLCLWKAYMNAGEKERTHLQRIVGNLNASLEEIRYASELVQSLGGISYAQNLARALVRGGNIDGTRIDGALSLLDCLRDSEYKRFLQLWADYMIEREF